MMNRENVRTKSYSTTMQMQQAVIESTLEDISKDAEFESNLVSSVSGLLDRMMKSSVEMV